MIKVGIVGGTTPQAGELIRILVNHPDVDLVFVQAAGRTGQSLKSVHHGLVGETDIDFTERCPLEKIDVLFVADPIWYASQPTPEFRPEDLKIIDLTGNAPDWLEAVPGVSEAFRKPLVRGAKAAEILHPLTSVGLIALSPLASHLLLKPLSIKATLPADLAGADIEYKAKSRLADLLAEQQLSFGKEISLNVSPAVHSRALRMEITMKCPLTVADAIELFESRYDDHNFTFIIDPPLIESEVVGTNKCVILISKPEADSLRVEALADARLRGGAGEAVHMMNLLFGLHEKTGLSLRASEFERGV